MSDSSTLFSVAILALAVGVAVGMMVGRSGRRRGGSPSSSHEMGVGSDVAGRENGVLRAHALEVAAEPILIVGREGRLRDCNAAALSLLDRHRAEVTNSDAATIRVLLATDGSPLDWGELVSRRSPWSGEAHVRLPDGSRRTALARLVPIFGDNGEVAAMVEVYHGTSGHVLHAADRFLRALDSGDEPSDGDAPPPSDAAGRELRLLILAFDDLSRLLAQYQRLLPAMEAEDPMSEAIAGLAAETSEMTASADVPRLMQEVPRTFDRLQGALLRLAVKTPPDGSITR